MRFWEEYLAARCSLNMIGVSASRGSAEKVIPRVEIFEYDWPWLRKECHAAKRIASCHPAKTLSEVDVSLPCRNHKCSRQFRSKNPLKDIEFRPHWKVSASFGPGLASYIPISVFESIKCFRYFGIGEMLSSLNVIFPRNSSTLTRIPVTVNIWTSSRDTTALTIAMKKRLSSSTSRRQNISTHVFTGSRTYI